MATSIRGRPITNYSVEELRDLLEETDEDDEIDAIQKELVERGEEEGPANLGEYLLNDPLAGDPFEEFALPPSPPASPPPASPLVAAQPAVAGPVVASVAAPVVAPVDEENEDIQGMRNDELEILLNDPDLDPGTRQQIRQEIETRRRRIAREESKEEAVPDEGADEADEADEEDEVDLQYRRDETLKMLHEYEKKGDVFMAYELRKALKELGVPIELGPNPENAPSSPESDSEEEEEEEEELLSSGSDSDSDSEEGEAVYFEDSDSDSEEDAPFYGDDAPEAEEEEADDAEHIKALEKDMKDDKKSSKMKMSELKAKIKEMALSEMNLNISDETPESEEDFLAEVDRILAEADEVAVDDTEVAVDGKENIDVDTTIQVDPNVKAVQDALTQAQAAAQTLGDAKLTDQIGNTITFFTRNHVVEKGAVSENLNESMFPMLKKILK